MQSAVKAPLAFPSLTVGSASLIVSYLEAIGVDHVFGVPGGAIEPLYNAAYAGLPDMELTVIDDSFHFIMFDQPEAFEAGLRAGLAD